MDSKEKSWQKISIYDNITKLSSREGSERAERDYWMKKVVDKLLKVWYNTEAYKLSLSKISKGFEKSFKKLWKKYWQT